jgi:hypothetical protein
MRSVFSRPDESISTEYEVRRRYTFINRYKNQLILPQYKFPYYKDMFINILFTGILRGSRGRDRMVAGLTTTHAICAYHH